MVKKSDYEKHERRIDAVEIYPPYVTGLQRSIYDEILLCEASDEIPRLGPYDLILLIDLLQHLGRQRAEGSSRLA